MSTRPADTMCAYVCVRAYVCACVYIQEDDEQYIVVRESDILAALA